MRLETDPSQPGVFNRKIAAAILYRLPTTLASIPFREADAMVLHLLADPDYDPIESEDIRLLPEDPKAKPPVIHDWAADTKEQTITHTSSGCQFRAIRMKPPLVNGLSLPFEHSYEIAVRFVGMRDNTPRPAHERVRELGRQGLTWILTYTYESSRRKT